MACRRNMPAVDPFRVQKLRTAQPSSSSATAVAAAAHVVPVAAWRQGTATETVTARNATCDRAEVLRLREGTTFGGRIRNSVAPRAGLGHRMRRRARRGCQNHAWLTGGAVRHRVKERKEAVPDVGRQERQSIKELAI